MGDLGVLPDPDDEEGDEAGAGGLGSIKSQAGALTANHDGSAEPLALGSSGSNQIAMGKPWVEEIIEGSALGRIKRRRGGNTSTDGSIKVEWEIFEYDGSDPAGPSESSGSGNGKRKIGDIAGDEAAMGGRQ